MKDKYKVIISGVGGYVGKELFALVHCHPNLQLAGIHSRDDAHTLDQTSLSSNQSSLPIYSTKDIQALSKQIDVIFLATPPEVSMEIVAELIDTGILILDLSGAFRLAADKFESWYGFSHAYPELISKACYGLVPWASQQMNYQLIANPGCYATCVLMSLLPLLKANLIQEKHLVIDAKSGVSGAGKTVKKQFMFGEIEGNFFPYKISGHQHTPEIQQSIVEHADKSLNFRLTTAILPIFRGISMAIYAEASAGFYSDAAISKAIDTAFYKAYHDYPLIEYCEIDTGDVLEDQRILSLKSVTQTPNTQVGYYVKNGQITLFSCIDNLLKGAASQAIENINQYYGLPLNTGLSFPGRVS